MTQKASLVKITYNQTVDILNMLDLLESSMELYLVRYRGKACALQR